MLGLTLSKMMTGGTLGPDQIKKLLASVGARVDFADVEGRESLERAFQGTAEAAVQTGTRVMQIQGTLPDGEPFKALVVLG